MTDLFAGFFYLAFVLLALVSPFLRLRHILPTAALAALSWSAGELLAGPVRLQDQDIGYAIGVAILQIFVATVGLGVSLRFVIADILGHLNNPIFPRRWAETRIIHRLVLIAGGVVTGLILAIGLARLFAGTAGGCYLDAGIALATGGAAFTAIRHLPPFASTPVAAACLTVMLVALGGSMQPWLIVNQAEALAAGQPWCLVGPAGTQPITSTRQLGFFSLPKGTGYPHLALRLDGPDASDKAHWSIRKQRMESGWGTGVLPCRTRSDYGTALRAGQLDPA